MEEHSSQIEDLRCIETSLPLADIRDVTVDPDLPREERIAEFLRQIKNPYCFRCGKFTIRASYAQDGVSLEDCLKQIIM